jgi:hypothetical protein
VWMAAGCVQSSQRWQLGRGEPPFLFAFFCALCSYCTQQQEKEEIMCVFVGVCFSQGYIVRVYKDQALVSYFVLPTCFAMGSSMTTVSVGGGSGCVACVLCVCFEVIRL